MEKNIYSFIVEVNNCPRFESLLNSFRIGLNDWDNSKVFNIQGYNVVNYTVVCTLDSYMSIMNLMYDN